MRKFVHWVIELKTYAGLAYCATVGVAMVVFWACGWDAIPISMLLQMMLMCLCSAILQWLCFSPQFLGKTRYTLRVALFLIVFLALLTAFAWLWNWLPRENLGAWGLFLIIFLVISAVMTLGYEIFFRASGKRYDDLLEQYRKTHPGK